MSEPLSDARPAPTTRRPHKRRFSLAVEMGVMFVLLGLLPMFLIGLIYFQIAEEQLRSEILHNLSITADSKAGRLETFARDRLRDTSMLASSPLVGDAFDHLQGGPVTPDLEDRVVGSLTRSADALGVKDLFLIAPSGDVIYAVQDKSAMGVNLMASATPLGPRLTPLISAFDRARTLLEPQLSEFSEDPATRELVAFSTAPMMQGGRLLGVVALRLDEDEIFRIVSDYTGMGSTGEALVAGPQPGSSPSRPLDGVQIHGPSRFPDALPGDGILPISAPAARPLLQALSGDRGGGEGIDYRGESVVVAWRYLPSFQWALEVKADEAERMASLNRLRTMGLLSLGGAILLILAVSPLMAAAITQPIRELEAATHQFSEGKMQQLRLSGGPWEVRSLARAFNDMVRRVTAYQGGLRRMVDEQTAELRAAKELAESSTRAKSEFLAMMSHELRTPLNGIMGVAELLAGCPLSKEARAHVETIQASGASLTELLNDILDISRVEAGRLTFEEKDFDPNALLRGLADLMRHGAEDKGLSLTVNPPQTPVPLPAVVRGDPARLRQILLNLVGNAIKFTPEGSVCLSLDCVRRDGEMALLRFTVSDTGIGIPDEARSRLTEPFFQVDADRSARYGGAGLGLSICRRLIDGMGGVLSLSSTLGKGSEFHVNLTFPLAGDGGPVAKAKPAPAALRVSPLRILLVEDDAVNRRVLEGFLARDQHVVRSVDNGASALELVETDHFDMVLTDLRLPGLSGLDVARRVRERQGPPVVAVTANLMPEDQAACANAGVLRVVGKPILLADLRAAVALVTATIKGRGAKAGGHDVAEVKPDDGPQPSSQDNEKIFDSRYLRDMADVLPEDRIRDLAVTVEKTFQDLLPLLRSAIQDQDRSEIASLAHRIAGTAGIYGLSALRQQAKLWQAWAEADDVQIPLPAPIEDDLVDRSLAAMKAWMDGATFSASPCMK